MGSSVGTVRRDPAGRSRAVERARAARRAVVSRLVAVEAAAVAAGLAAESGSVPFMALAGLIAVVTLVVAFARGGGRWWAETVAAWVRLRRRQATAGAAYLIRGHDDRGTVVGIGCDEGGWYAAVAVSPLTTMSGVRTVDVPLGRFAEIVATAGVPLTAVQVVSWVAPAPHYLLSRQVPSAESYRQLVADLVDAGPPPLDRRDWIAVRLNVADASAAAHARGGGIDGVHRAVAAAIGRVAKALSAAGIEFEVLGPQQLDAALRTGIGLHPRGDGAVVERWSGCSAGGVDHVSFEVLGLPTTGASLWSLLGAPAAHLALAMELRRPGDDGGPVGLRAMVRVASTPGRLGDVTRVLTAQAEQIGVRLRRLDGWHGPAAYASAPTGGGPW